MPYLRSRRELPPAAIQPAHRSLDHAVSAFRFIDVRTPTRRQISGSISSSSTRRIPMSSGAEWNDIGADVILGSLKRLVSGWFAFMHENTMYLCVLP